MSNAWLAARRGEHCQTTSLSSVNPWSECIRVHSCRFVVKIRRMASADDRRMSTRATGVVGIAILSSRVLGLIREMVFAGLFGAGKNLDAFLMAFRLPNLLRDLFAEGALSTAFITTFSKKIAIEGDQSAWRLGNKVATLVAVFMSAVTLLGIIFAPQIVYVITGWGAWSPEKTETTILLTRIMWPFILLVSLAALVMGMLNAKNIF